MLFGIDIFTLGGNEYALGDVNKSFQTAKGQILNVPTAIIEIAISFQNS